MKSRRNKRNRKYRTKRRKMVGAGIFSFGKEVANNIVFSEIKPLGSYNENEYNKTFETIVTPDSGKEYIVFFVTPQTLLFNNVNSTRVPTFIINGRVQNLKIKNRYVDYLVRIESKWYAILRIVFAVNTGFFASYTYTIFYRLNNVIQFDNDGNSINIKEENYDRKREFTLGLFKDKNESLVLKESTYEPITNRNDDIFLVLRKFRNVQLQSFAIKQGAVNALINEAVDFP